MSALGQERTLPACLPMSAFPPKADKQQTSPFVRYVPQPAVSNRSKAAGYSMTASARASTVAGTSRPSALAVLRLITSSYLVGAHSGLFDCLVNLRQQRWRDGQVERLRAVGAAGWRAQARIFVGRWARAPVVQRGGARGRMAVAVGGTEVSGSWLRASMAWRLSSLD